MNSSKTSPNHSYPLYKYQQVTKYLRCREIGLSCNTFRRKLNRCTSNSREDFDILRSLYCADGAYLETIACRKILRSKAPAFCHGRLFTENYQTWFNLFTGPTSGPLLITSDLFSSEDINISSTTSATRDVQPKIKVVDVVCVSPPFSCKPPENGSWRGLQLAMLTKSGWLYIVDLEESKTLNKVFVPTKQFSSTVYDTCEQIEETPRSSEFLEQSEGPFSYQYISINRECESIVVKSSRQFCQQSHTSTTAFCTFSLYPLKLDSHFIVTVTSHTNNPAFSADIVNDLFVLSSTRASKISFFGLKEVLAEHHLNKRFSLQQQVRVLTRCGFYRSRLAFVGDESLGIPYTSKKIELKFSACLFKQAPCLFKAVAMKQSLQIGGIPHHYLVSNNKTGTSWSLKHVLDHSEVSSGHIQVEEKWDSSHWGGVRFHSDDSGRVIRQDLSVLELLSIERDTTMGESNVTTDLRQETSKSAARSCGNCRVSTSFAIDVKPIAKPEPEEIPWQYPRTNEIRPFPPHTVTSSGRHIRKPRPWFSNTSELDDHDGYLLVSVEYDVELNVLALLYYRPIELVTPGWETEDERSALVVSLFDNNFGGHISTFVLEENVSPADRDSVSLTIDQDTLVFTRLRANDNRLTYKILRLNRRYGSETS